MLDDQSPQFTTTLPQWDNLKPLAQEMRHQPTPSEDIIWESVRARRLNGAKFRRQHAIDGFIVDFVCIERRLIIEIDGEIHQDVDQQMYDVERQMLLEARGFRVLRFTNEQVFHWLQAVLDDIGAAIAE